MDLIGTYSKSIIKNKPCGTVIHKNARLTCMPMIDPATVCFEIIGITMFDFKELELHNDEYIDK